MSEEQMRMAFDETVRVLQSLFLVDAWLSFIPIFIGLWVITKISDFLSALPPVQETVPEIPTRKVISFREGIYKKNSNTLTCSCCSARYDMSDIKIKFDQHGYFDCQCGAELCRLVVERVL